MEIYSSKMYSSKINIDGLTKGASHLHLVLFVDSDAGWGVDILNNLKEHKVQHHRVVYLFCWSKNLQRETDLK